MDIGEEEEVIEVVPIPVPAEEPVVVPAPVEPAKEPVPV